MSLAKAVAIAAAMYLAPQSPANAATMSAEVAATKEIDVVDIKLSGPITDGVNHYVRSLTTIDNKTNGVSHFAFADAIVPLGNGLDILAEVQFPAGGKTDFRPGFQYFRQLSALLLGGIYTRNCTSNPNNEMFLIINYSPAIGKETTLVANFEPCVNIRDKGYNFDSAKARLGVKKGSVSGGLAAELNSLWKKATAQFGVFISKDL